VHYAVDVIFCFNILKSNCFTFSVPAGDGVVRVA
jgi:hypothetical protein